MKPFIPFVNNNELPSNNNINVNQTVYGPFTYGNGMPFAFPPTQNCPPFPVISNGMEVPPPLLFGNGSPIGIVPNFYNFLPVPLPPRTNFLPYGGYNNVVNNSPQNQAQQPQQDDLKAIEDYIVSLLNQSKINSSNENTNQGSEKKIEPTIVESSEDKKKDLEQTKILQKTTPKIKKDKFITTQKSSNDIEQLTNEIVVIYEMLKPSLSNLDKRLNLLSRLQMIVHKNWPDANLNLRMFGSSSSEFAFKNADMDICLIINEESKVGTERDIIQKLGELLRKKNMKNIKTLPVARVPIVKFNDFKTNISCDICVNNTLALHNTSLLADYSRIDPRLKQLGFIVKYWAKKRQINDPYRGTLSSYAYILMVIHFLQQRNPPILPCLQQLSDPEEPIQRIDVEGYDCYYYRKVDLLKEFGKTNDESIGELLIAFFKLYACEFDWENMVVSVRTGKYLSKSEKHWEKRNKETRDNFYFALEDPFEITHNLGRLVDIDTLKVLRLEFERAYKLISSNNGSIKTVCKKFSKYES